MSDLPAGIRDAWSDAGLDLGLTIVFGEEGRFLLWIADFGGPGGTVVFARGHTSPRDVEAARASGFFCSVLPDAYATYDRSLFVATLDDWGWFGNDDPPDWFSGESWV